MSDDSSSSPIPKGALTALEALHRAAADARKTAIQTHTGIVIHCGDDLVELGIAALNAEKRPKPD